MAVANKPKIAIYMTYHYIELTSQISELPK